MQVVNFPHPALRRPSKPLRRVDAELHNLIREMFEIMYEHEGVGLAANQVNLPYRLFIMNPEADRSQPDLEYVFINPVLSHPKGSEEKEEGCLSLPKLYADVRRPERITVQAYNLAGQQVQIEADGLFARIVQHETDHLDGKLFIDRLTTTAEITVRDKLDEFATVFTSQRKRGEIPSDEELEKYWAEMERLRT